MNLYTLGTCRDLRPCFHCITGSVALATKARLVATFPLAAQHQLLRAIPSAIACRLGPQTLNRRVQREEQVRYHQRDLLVPDRHRHPRLLLGWWRAL
jgi:hypothetical protein